MRRVWFVLAFAAVVGAVLLLRPVCVPLSDQAVAASTVPLERRTDRDFHLRVFRRRDGRWHQCKTWLSRTLFF